LRLPLRRGFAEEDGILDVDDHKGLGHFGGGFRGWMSKAA
jgi:hypothetical protein